MFVKKELANFLQVIQMFLQVRLKMQKNSKLCYYDNEKVYH